MSETRGDAARPATVGQRLRQARHRWFLGRTGELELFCSALDAPEPPFSVLHVHGPGGVGKTALLRAFADAARSAGATVVPLDARDFEPSPPGFTAAVQAAIGLDQDADLEAALAGGGRAVVLLDTYETAAPLDDWLRERFLPGLPADAVVVLAGRQPPAPGWRAEAAWRDLLRVISLRNLRPEESRAYLRAAGVPEPLHESVLAFTHGHPLALSLVVDVLAQERRRGPVAGFVPERAPDVMRELLARFVAGVPGALHRRALEVCAHARLTTEDLLRAALGRADVHDVFEWLRSLSFVEQGPFGLSPHDLAREVLDADLRWRDRQEYGLLHEGIRAHVLARVRRTSGQEQQRALLDFMFLHRGNPFTQPYWEWASFGQVYADPVTPADHQAILAMTAKHEGEGSAAMVAHWLQRQPAAFIAFRGGDGVLLGFTAILFLDRASAADIEVDPGTRAVWAYAQRHGPPRPGERVTQGRFLVDRDSYQATSPAINLISVQCTRHWLTTPNLAWDFLSMADPDHWGPLFAYLDYHRVHEADFEVGGHRAATFAHDWRRVPVEPWLALMARRELDVEFEVAAPAPGGPAQPLALSQPEFDQAVRRALHDLHRPDLLAANPLVRSRLVRERAADGSPGGALAELLREAAARLGADPRDDKLLRAVDRTYLRPATTQERAAELLGLPFSTYRRHLGQGVARVVADLWARELYGPAGQG
jgi:AAA ATPase domain